MATQNCIRVAPFYADPSARKSDSSHFPVCRISEHIQPCGHLGDPLPGLAIVWIHDRYPFVHTGFVEQYLVRHDVGRRVFAVRLGIQVLATIVNELRDGQLDGGNGCVKGLRALLDRADEWL